MARCTWTSWHPNNTLIPPIFFPPPLLLYLSNSSFLPSFPFLFPLWNLQGLGRLLPRERDRDIRDARRESRELNHLYDGDPRHSERERIRQYECIHAPKSTQDYTSGRERPTPQFLECRPIHLLVGQSSASTPTKT